MCDSGYEQRGSFQILLFKYLLFGHNGTGRLGKY